MTSKYVNIFLLLYAVTNEKTLKLTQIDRLLAASNIFPAETRYIYQGIYVTTDIPTRVGISVVIYTLVHTVKYEGSSSIL